MKTHKDLIIESMFEVKQIERPIRKGIIDLMVSPAMRIIPEISEFLDGIDLMLMQSLEDIKRVSNIYRPYKNKDDVS
jgi:sulfatase maturation enzyme AslB (radical SAM superfamily)